ncbi:MAG TPA: ShlB/FhaC/HecB family hemolysin secretion/activation protein, partial [Moraxellaceae bacterium]
MDIPPDDSARLQEQQRLELQRQQQREDVLRQQNEPVAAVSPPAAAPSVPHLTYPAREQPCFVIDQIELVGEEAQRFEFALRAVIAAEDSPLHRCLGAEGVNVVMTRVQNIILQRGFITTRVLAPPQNVSSGHLRLQLLPGRLHAIRRVEHAPSRLQLWTALPSREGALLNLRDMEQGVENLKRLPTVEADIQVEPAAGLAPRPGESDLALRWRQEFPWRFSASLDDSGSDNTGKYQGSVTFSYDNPFGLNDLFYVTATHDLNKGSDFPQGTEGYFGHYSLPFSYWLLAFSASRNAYHQSVAGATQTYRYSGRSSNQDVKLSRVLYRSAQRKTTAALR